MSVTPPLPFPLLKINKMLITKKSYNTHCGILKKLKSHLKVAPVLFYFFFVVVVLFLLLILYVLFSLTFNNQHMHDIQHG